MNANATCPNHWSRKQSAPSGAQEPRRSRRRSAGRASVALCTVKPAGYNAVVAVAAVTEKISV